MNRAPRQPTSVKKSLSEKRKLSTTDGGGNPERVVKRRAAKACQSCRTRRVRCDVLVNGDRCTNCTLDDLECIVLKSKRGKTGRSQSESQAWALSISPSSTSVANIIASSSVDDEVQPTPTSQFSDFAAPNSNEVPVCITFDHENARDVSESRLEESNRFSIPESPGAPLSTDCLPENNLETDTRGSSSSGAPQPPLTVNSVLASISPGGRATDPFTELQLPSYIKPLPLNIDAEDINYLAKKGAFVIPAQELRSKILESYVCSVHTFLPVLDVDDFTYTVLNENSGRQVSLLLLQAVMFAGLSSLKMDIIHQLGFETPKQARKAFFEKARLLYDCETELDDTAALQSLLLMSLWYEGWSQRKHTWFWTGQALSLAQSAGFHRARSAPSFPPRVNRLRRRIWWSLYIRDRLIGLGTRRPMRIKDEEFDVTILTVQDFDNEPLDDSYGASLGTSPPPREISDNRHLAIMCVELAKLCKCIGNVLSSRYTTVGEQTPLNSTLMVVPKRPPEHPDTLSKLDEELQHWHQNLDPEVLRIASEADRGVSADREGIPWSILQMIYLTTISLLHRPQVFLPCPSSAVMAQMRRNSRERVKDTARELTKLLHTMLRRDQIRFLPTSGIPAALSAALGHMLEVKSTHEDVRDASIFRLYQTMQILQKLREIYASADSAVSFLASAVGKAGIGVRYQEATHAMTDFMVAGIGKMRSQLGASSCSNISDDSTLPQAPRPINTSNAPRSPADLRAEYNLKKLPAESCHRFLMSDQTYECTRNGLNSPIKLNYAHLSANGSIGRHSSGHGPKQGGQRGSMGDLQSEIGEVASPGPVSYWVVDDGVVAEDGDFGISGTVDPISVNYEFGPDVFGLLDGLGSVDWEQ